MKVIRWSHDRSSSDLHPVRFDVDRLFGTLLGPASPVRERTALSPAMDVEETPEAFVFKADVPGLNHSDIKVSFSGDTLVIRGERQRETLSGESNSHRVERVYGAFERSFKLNTPVRGDQIQATCRDGVLEVRVPKAEEA